MWNKILLAAALALALFASFLFYRNFEQIGKMGGEVSAVQKQFQDSISEATNIAIDEREKKYAEMRIERFTAEEARFVSEKQALDSETETVVQDTATTNAQFEELREEYEKLQAEIEALKKEVSEAAKLGTVASDVDAIVEEVVRLTDEAATLKADIAREEARFAQLEKENNRLVGEVRAGRKLNSDRMARISPADLDATVILADTDWEYIIIDAGVNKGIVVGSRLAVMRNGVKICELDVTMVEQNRTSADIIHNTLLPGEMVKAGDKIVSVRY